MLFSLVENHDDLLLLWCISHSCENYRRKRYVKIPTLEEVDRRDSGMEVDNGSAGASPSAA